MTLVTKLAVISLCSSQPVKRRKTESKSPVNVIQGEKANAASAGGYNSDSDSSLDVEKWRNRVLQMTGVCKTK